MFRNEELKPLKELHPSIVTELFKAAENYALEFYQNGEWSERGKYSLHVDRIYRVGVINDYIDWSQVHESYRYIARDAGGEVFLYTDRPSPGGNTLMWMTHKQDMVANAKVFRSYIEGDAPWDLSLAERPYNKKV